MNIFLLIVDIFLWLFTFERSSPQALAPAVLLGIGVSFYLNYRLTKQNHQSKWWLLAGLFGVYGVIAHYIQLIVKVNSAPPHAQNT
jgi:hypothetical protein